MKGINTGIIYLMSTVIDGLVKIGRCENDQYEHRMYNLEKNGFSNITGLKRVFAIRVDNYKDKEQLIHKILGRSQVSNTEFFSIDVNLAKQLLSALDGENVYPDTDKTVIFEEATEAVHNLSVKAGVYFLNKKSNKMNCNHKAQVKVDQGIITLLKGSTISPIMTDKSYTWLKNREELNIKNNILQEDYVCTSFSMAASLVVGNNVNGWNYWKSKEGNVIDEFRKDLSEE